MSIRFLPLDLPKFKHKEKVLAEFNPDTKFYCWNEEYITVRDRNITFHDAMPMRDVHKELVEYVKEYLPFTDIVLMKLIRANKDVFPHVDDNYVNYIGPKSDFNTITQEFKDHQLDTEPCGYRIVIEGDRKSFYLSNGKVELEDDELIYSDTNAEIIETELPESTDCFALKSYGSMHGVKKTENDDNRLLVFIIGWFDKDKHDALIKKSLEKYGEYVVR